MLTPAYGNDTTKATQFERDPYGAAALDSELDWLRAAAEGGRHESVYKSAIRMGQLVAARRLSRPHARTRLTTMAIALGLPTSSAIRQVERGLDWGISHPRTISDPMADVRATTQQQKVVQATHIFAQAEDNGDWSGSTGATRLRLLTAWFQIYSRVGKQHLTLSHRQWAEHAGVSPSVISRHYRSFQPWIIIEKTGTYWEGNSCSYRLGPGIPQSQNNHGLPSLRGPQDVLSMCNTQTNDFEGREQCEWRIHQLLNSSDSEQITVTEIVEQTGLHRNTVYNNLKRMVKKGMVTIAETIGRTSYWMSTNQVTNEEREEREFRRLTQKDRHAKDRSRWRESKTPEVCALRARRRRVKKLLDKWGVTQTPGRWVDAGEACG